MRQRGRRERRAFDFANPIDLIVDLVVWQMRWAGRRLITGVVLVGGLAIMSAAFFVPLLLAGVLIAVFGLAVEPYKWLGTVLIIVALVAGLVAAPVSLLHVARRARGIIALTVDLDIDDPSAAAPSPIAPSGPTREQWVAAVRALDERMTPPSDTSSRPPGPGPGSRAG